MCIKRCSTCITVSSKLHNNNHHHHEQQQHTTAIHNTILTTLPLNSVDQSFPSFVHGPRCAKFPNGGGLFGIASSQHHNVHIFRYCLLWQVELHVLGRFSSKVIRKHFGTTGTSAINSERTAFCILLTFK